MRSIALCGKAGSGKDTVAQYLCEAHGYTRLAFADPLKEMALTVDPFISLVAGEPVRLSRIVQLRGWEQAKQMFPEVRRTLQQMGQTVRALDRDFWVRTLLASALKARGPIVVSDMRYLNEYQSMHRAGFLTVRVVRPGAGLSGSAGAHISETELDGFPMVARLLNDGSLDLLHARADALIAVH